MHLRHALPLLCAASAFAQIVDTPDEVRADIPVNYTEAHSGSYTLPDLLTLANGQKVTDPSIWRQQRRPEILRLLEENQFGRAPGRPQQMHFDVFDKGTPAFGGSALRKQVTIYFGPGDTEPYLDLLVYLPAKASGPAPVLLQLGWIGNNLSVDDPGVKVGRTWNREEHKRVPSTDGRRIGRLNVEPLIERGIGVATFNYNDVDPDALDALSAGVRAMYLKPGETEPAPDEWGAVAAWSWGVSRAVDYLETDPLVDASKIALHGVSRLGKTTMWAAAKEERIACVIASVSGEGGAALSRRDYGETVAHLVEPTRYPYQFARNYAKWAFKMNEAPFDAHMLVALIAPRPLLLQTGNTDKWSDPYGEFLAAKAATPVYELLGKKGIEQYALPAAGEPLLNDLSYLMHDGGHGVMPSDWPVFVNFLAEHLLSKN
jgi:hypothetical protein